MKFRLALLAATVLAAPLALAHNAAAQPVTGPYVSLGLGYDVPSSEKTKNYYTNGVGAGYTGRIVQKNGEAVDVAIGYGLGNGFRAEVEGDYIHNTGDKTKISGVDFKSGGSDNQYGVFVNGLYDLDVGLPYLYPYLGAGIGYQEQDLHDYHPGFYSFSKAKGSVAYQGIVGAAFPITMVPGLSATLEYRYVADFRARKFNGSFAGFPATFKSETDNNNQIVLGVRYALYTPAPMVQAPAPAPVQAAAPAPVPAKTYLVFFDWDKSDLTPRATQIISEAAQSSHTANVTTLSVSGYTDTSGTPTYNQGLSERRAQAVAAQLVTDGVPQSEIEIHAYGETHLLVATGPNVREPQNRRVEIVLQ
jgi:outer membrane protein OmpA-like peptidoglycan-associated protein